MTPQPDRTLVLRSIDIAATPEAVHAALTEPAQLSKWLADEVDLEPIVGGRFRLAGANVLGGESVGAVVAMEPGRFAFTRPLDGLDTAIDVIVESEGSGCRVFWRHVLPGNDRDHLWYIAMDQANVALYNLRGYLEAGAPYCRPESKSPEGTVRLTVTIEAPADDVWTALTVPETMDRYLSTKAVVEPRVGGEYSFGWMEDGAPGGPTKFLEFEAGRRFVTDWFYPGDSENTQVAWEVESAGGKTTVTLTHSGFLPSDDLPGYVHGWAAFLGALKAIAEGRELIKKSLE